MCVCVRAFLHVCSTQESQITCHNEYDVVVVSYILVCEKHKESWTGEVSESQEIYIHINLYIYLMHKHHQRPKIFFFLNPFSLTSKIETNGCVTFSRRDHFSLASLRARNVYREWGLCWESYWGCLPVWTLIFNPGLIAGSGPWGSVLTGAICSSSTSKVYIKLLKHQMTLYGTQQEWLQESNVCMNRMALQSRPRKLDHLPK